MLETPKILSTNYNIIGKNFKDVIMGNQQETNKINNNL